MIALVVLSLVELKVNKGKILFPFRKAGWKRALKIMAYPSFAVLLLLFLVSAFRFYPIGDLDYLLTRLRIKVPFLVFPFVFLALPRFNKQDLQRFFYFFLVILTLTSIGIIINYLLDYEYYNQLIQKGQHIPSPRNHIRYSLFTALAIIGGIYLYSQKVSIRYSWEPKLILTLTFFLFLFIHFYSVKSGILVLYGSLVFGLIQYTIQKRQLLAGLIGFTILLSVPLVAYKTLPTLQRKVDYFYHDMFMYERGKGANLSDSGRLASLDAGWEITKNNWLWGVGTANIRAEVDHFFQEKYPDYPEVFMPQNQFLFSWGASGILGLLLTVFAFFQPVFYRKNYQHWFFLNFTFSIFIIIMIEHALENSVGVAHYLFFQLLFLNTINRDNDE